MRADLYEPLTLFDVVLPFVSPETEGADALCWFCQFPPNRDDRCKGCGKRKGQIR